MAKQEKRNPFSTNNNNKNSSPGEPKKGPKFGSYWAFIIILAIMLAFQFLNPLGSSRQEINISQFQNMLQKGHVSKYIIVTNKDRVRVWIKTDSLAAYPNANKNLVKGGEETPQFDFEIASPEVFNDQMEKFYARHPNLARIEPEVRSDNDFLGKAIGYLLPFVLLLGVWILLMRKMSGGAGGAGGPGGIFSIGKSKATLFDKGTKVNITFADVAGLDEAKVEVMEIVDFLRNPKNIQAWG
ncbi:ATP-dependent metallopeptidase FtsH/Yme1/Tma family protein [Niabella sp. W65]|nr:ATP-dependent metallopeptidase FtsH/Yme1/Tma family protein [Niabella sp. W65]MCH7368254.1 ATP-dependent metallopeptidase FtsH/Yme1/Tma family protein [Niabella sp. W65]ULT43862.1 ATP-dependent metallopeptidase FtsH/Yme1/Tma family protein [Niabella sp. I65]